MKRISKKFTTPEAVKLQYIVLDPKQITKSIQVSDAKINDYLKNHASTNSNEQVDVSHILFTVPAGADAHTRAEVKARAEKILEEVRANPKSFAEMARKYSQDPGSAKKWWRFGLLWSWCDG